MMHNTLASPLVVHVARTEAEKNAIYRLRYRVYIEEQRKEYAADHDHRLLRDPRDDDAEHLCIVIGERVVGAVRLHFGGAAPHPLLPPAPFRAGRDQETAFVSRLVVERSERGGNVTPQLFRAMYRYAVENGVRHALTWCVPVLAPLYERVGFRRYAAPFVDAVVGDMVPLYFACDDVAYLRRIGSGLSPVADMYFGAKSRCA